VDLGLELDSDLGLDMDSDVGMGLDLGLDMDSDLGMGLDLGMSGGLTGRETGVVTAAAAMAPADAINMAIAAVHSSTGTHVVTGLSAGQPPGARIMS